MISTDEQRAAMAAPGVAALNTADTPRMQAEALCRGGLACEDVSEAEEFYRAAVAIDPSFGPGHRRLGTLLHLSGRPADAIDCYRQVLALEPGDARISSNLGAALCHVRRYAEARECLLAALEIEPDYAGAHCNLGIVHESTGRLDLAEAAYRRATELEPSDPVAHNNLGHVLILLGRAEEAAPSLSEAVRLRPRYAEAHTNLGIALQALGRIEEAVMCHRAAIDINPGFADAHANLGVALRAAGREEEGLAAYDAALRNDPNHPDALANRGLALRQLGRLDDAVEAFRTAIARWPNSGKLYRYLSEARRTRPDDAHLAQLQALLCKGERLPLADRVDLHFALGKCWHDLRRDEEALEQFLAACALKRRTLDYDEASALQPMTAIKALFTPEFLGKRRGFGDPSGSPIFIVGMPRSGSTLIEQILASHRNAAGIGEVRHFEDSLRDALHGKIGGGFANKHLARLDAATWADIGRRYVAALKRDAPDVDRIVDKMPGNFLFLGLIHLALPNARIIHTVRDPLDCAVSCLSHHFAGASHAYSYDLRELGRYYRAYQSMMAHWHEVLPGVILDVQYEALVADLPGQTRRILDHCGLDWDESCLDFHRTPRSVRTASAVQVRQPLYNTSIGRFSTFRDLLAPLIAALDEPSPV